MSHLNPKAEELVRAGRAAFRPTDADRERVFQALQPRLGGNPESHDIEPFSTTPAKASLTIKATAVLAGMSLAGAGLYVMLQSNVPPAGPAAVAPVTTEVVPQEVVEPTPKTAPSVAPHGPSFEEKRATAAPRSADSLAKEIAMLSQASADLHAGRPSVALTVLDEHQRKFPHGELVQERTSARIQALCALGRMAEAQVELARLARTAPNSPHLARARKACGPGAAQKD